MALEVNPAAAGAATYRSAPVRRSEHVENTFTRLVEQQTAKVPSSYFLFAALCSMGVSLGLALRGREHTSRFVGMWVAPLLIMGVYNKLVKTIGPQ